MDERLQRSLEFSNYRLTVANQKNNIKNQVLDKLIVYFNSGQFTADPITLSYIKTLSEFNKEAIVLDSLRNPIKITNLKEFLEKLLTVHNESLNNYYSEFQKINRARNVKKLLNLEENE